jgi:hypothetical protein
VGKTIAYNVATNNIIDLSDLYVARDWTGRPLSQEFSFQTSTANYDNVDAMLYIATLNETSITPLHQLEAGCDLMWRPDGELLAYIKRGQPLEDCTRKAQALVFFNRTTQQITEHPLPADREILAVGWLKRF